jgi:hypothetical protein
MNQSTQLIDRLADLQPDIPEKITEAVDQAAADELRLYIDNDADLYRQQFIPMVKNMKRKMKSGKFDKAKAPKLLLYLVDNGARKYVKEHGSPGSNIKDMFPKPLRMEVAKDMARDMQIAIENGEYDDA